MENNLVPIIIKKEGVSDDSYKIIDLYSEHGTWVKCGDIILCIETSKIAIDIESPADGYLFLDVQQNQEVKIGQTIAVVSEEENFGYKNWFGTIDTSNKFTDKNEDVTIKISKPAQKIIDQNNIDIAVFNNSKMITKEDVENYLLRIQETNDLDTLSVNKDSLLIFGGGGHAKMCIDIVKQTKEYDIIGIVDDNIAVQTEVLDIPVIGNVNIIDKLIKKGLKQIVLGIGGVLTKGLRKKIFNSLKEKGLKIPNIIHTSALIEPSAFLGNGNQIMQGVIMGSNVKIGNNCIINSGSIISHDTIIGDNVHIAPGAIIGGGVVIKNDTIIGMGCTIFLGLTIGENVIIQNGLNIFKNVQDNSYLKKDTKD
ncbi:MAG: NeuD/PglB/VioB family sugar acetyltransferase [Polaribacter sp.]